VYIVFYLKENSMTDKVQKIREEVEMVVSRRLNLLNGDYFDLNKEVDGFTNEIMDIVDSLQEEHAEAKETDLEKIINDYFKDWKFDNELDIMVKPNNYSASFTDLKEIVKHFFELGAQKGE